MSNVARLALAWTYDPSSSTRPSQPIVWGGVGMRKPFVYVAAGGRLRALDLASGQLRWQAKTGIWASIAVADGDILLHYSGVYLRRYVPRSGHIVWQRVLRTENGPERQVVADGIWYTMMDWTLYAYDARTGRVRWTRPFDCFHCSVAASSGRVYVAGDPAGDTADGPPQGRLFALDARTGDTIWAAGTPGDYSSPVLADGRIFVRTTGGHEGAWTFSIEAFNASDGTHLWSAPVGTAKGFWFGPPAADAALVVYPSEDGFLYAVDADTGAELWKVPDINNGVRPAIVNGLVWAGDTDGHLVALDARDGRKLWSSPSLGTDPGSPVIAGAFVLCGSTDGRILAYRVPA